MIYKMGTLRGEKSWRRLRGFRHLAKVIEGVQFNDGIELIEDSRVAGMNNPPYTRIDHSSRFFGLGAPRLRSPSGQGPNHSLTAAQSIAPCSRRQSPPIDRNHETDMPATTVTTYPQTVHPVEQFDLGFIERSACPCPSDACQYFVRFSLLPQGVVDLSHAVVLGNEERTHPLYPFIAPAPRFNVIDGPRAMRPVPTPPGFGERSDPHKRVELAGREPSTLTHVVLKQNGYPGRAHTAPRIRTTFGASVPVTKRHHCAMIGRRRSSRSVRT